MSACWSCERAHTGWVWCPHCSAPVDPGSREAAMSPYWRADPRRTGGTKPDVFTDRPLRGVPT